MFFRDVLDQSGYEFHNGDRLYYESAVLMPVVVESYILTIIVVNAGSGNDRTAEITTDIFGNNFRVTFVWLSVDIKPIFMIKIAFRFHFFERWTNLLFHEVKKSCTKGIAKISIVEIL